MQEVSTVEAALQDIEDMAMMHEGALFRLATELGDAEMLRLVFLAYLRRFDFEAREPKSISVQW